MNVISVLLIFSIIAAFIVTAWVYVKNRTLDDIRDDVYALFLKAEHRYTESGSGKQKMEFVIQRARSMLPSWARLFITDEVLEAAVEMWFRAIKDLLDDGKLNGTK